MLSVASGGMLVSKLRSPPECRPRELDGRRRRSICACMRLIDVRHKFAFMAAEMAAWS